MNSDNTENMNQSRSSFRSRAYFPEQSEQKSNYPLKSELKAHIDKLRGYMNASDRGPDRDLVERVQTSIDKIYQRYGQSLNSHSILKSMDKKNTNCDAEPAVLDNHSPRPQSKRDHQQFVKQPQHQKTTTIEVQTSIQALSDEIFSAYEGSSTQHSARPLSSSPLQKRKSINSVRKSSDQSGTTANTFSTKPCSLLVSKSLNNSGSINSIIHNRNSQPQRLSPLQPPSSGTLPFAFRKRTHSVLKQEEILQKHEKIMKEFRSGTLTDRPKIKEVVFDRLSYTKDSSAAPKRPSKRNGSLIISDRPSTGSELVLPTFIQKRDTQYIRNIVDNLESCIRLAEKQHNINKSHFMNAATNEQKENTPAEGIKIYQKFRGRSVTSTRLSADSTNRILELKTRDSSVGTKTASETAEVKEESFTSKVKRLLVSRAETQTNKSQFGTPKFQNDSVNIARFSLTSKPTETRTAPPSNDNSDEDDKLRILSIKSILKKPI